jgi:hypothetical protein
MKSPMLLALAFLLTVPLALSQTQMKATIMSDRIKAKPGKAAALKNAIAEPAAKYQTGNGRWGAFSLLSGPEAAGYMINVAPNEWTIFPKSAKKPSC